MQRPRGHPENFRWQDWPQSAVSKGYIQRSARPNAVKELAGSVARSPMLPGEPVTAQKLVKAGDGGVLAAILPAGMRAISTRIKEETAAGRLILPNDHVDVLLTQRKRGRSGGDDFATETLFHNVRVLAIGLTGRAPGKYNLYLDSGFYGQRLNKLVLENVGEDAILDKLGGVIAHYARDRKVSEHFGDFALRAGYLNTTQDNSP